MNHKARGILGGLGSAGTLLLTVLRTYESSGYLLDLQIEGTLLWRQGKPSEKANGKRYELKS